MSPSEWTPDQPLRADATDMQIKQRRVHITLHLAPSAWSEAEFLEAHARTAREYAAAKVAEIAETSLLGWLFDERLGLEFITADGESDGARKREYWAVEGVTPNLYRDTPWEAIEVARKYGDPALFRSLREGPEE